jgi:hypothetical protein
MTTEYDRADSSHKSIVTLYFDYNIKVLSNWSLKTEKFNISRSTAFQKLPLWFLDLENFRKLEIEFRNFRIFETERKSHNFLKNWNNKISLNMIIRCRILIETTVYYVGLSAGEVRSDFKIAGYCFRKALFIRICLEFNVVKEP